MLAAANGPVLLYVLFGSAAEKLAWSLNARPSGAHVNEAS